ncbi:MAG TPA: ATP-binding protein [Candidatus Methylomirabilis sp.]|nr:ATP-binding protein [Candidatus Methylomirabilis sp.]
MTQPPPNPGQTFGAAGPGRLDGFLLTRTPLGRLVRWVAGLQTSVRSKLLFAFLLIVLLLIGVGATSLQILSSMGRHLRGLDEAHERVHWTQQIEHALALQMHYTAIALVRRDEAAVAQILRENNRFNDTLARIAAAAPPDERALIQQIRVSQDDAMAVVADIANSIREGKIDDALHALTAREDPLYRTIEGLVRQVVHAEETRMATFRAGVTAATHRSLIAIGAFATVAILLALLFGFVISWSFILPVQAAHEFLGQVAAGNFGVTVATANRDEFGALAENMNRMSRDLKRLDEEQRAAAAELRSLNERLAQASRAKTEFLASMSHELRTPLNAILGFGELMLDNLYGEVPESLREPLLDIQTNGRHLLRLINDVLDLSKIEAGRMELAPSEYVVSDMLETVRASLRSLASEKGLDFVVTAAPDLPLAYGDGKRLAQCLLNLAGNAIKFTKEGRVEIAAERRGALLVYRVSDTGIGIPEDQLDDVFAEFRQVNATISREYGGTGLGLSITKKFVELHGGRIWVESTVGKGSTFSFEVPVRLPDGRGA